MSSHPELESEQAYLDHAYACLEAMRDSARLLQQSVQTGAGGTHQARFERDVTYDRGSARLAKLQLGTESLCFGRIDREADAATPDGSRSDGERFYIGRLPISDAEQNPVIVDWRAPVAEAFYRATGRNPLGLTRRRHFATEASRLVGIDDEVFSIETLESDGTELVGTGALLAALGRSRSGHMRDIVATIQVEQDEIIRADQHGVLVVQGGPGTGKTAVALHRASYLLYTYRFPLERQGVLVVGPNRLFMRYISRVLPALGETEVELASVKELFPGVVASARLDPPITVLVKGDVRMAKFVRRAVATRQRGLRDDLVLGFGLVELRVTAAETVELAESVKRQHRQHNAGRRHLSGLLIDRLFARYREALARIGRTPDEGGVPRDAFAAMIGRDEAFKIALERMWPVLTAQALLRDLFGAPALIKAAGRDLLNDDEQRALVRDRGPSLESMRWSVADVPLLDEASTLLGPIELKAHDEHRTYGHIVIDEAQDLSPMQLRLLSRRSLSGSMTIVGDIGQATGMWAPKSWDEVTAHLPHKKAPRTVQLTVGYRTPAEIMNLAARVLAEAAPDLKIPSSVRSVGYEPAVVRAESGESIEAATIRAVQGIMRIVGEGTVGVLCPDELVDIVHAKLTAAAIPVEATVERGISVLAVRAAKGLEFDGVVVVEPAAVVGGDGGPGLRRVYVAMTRPTKALTLVHSQPLPACLSSED